MRRGRRKPTHGSCLAAIRAWVKNDPLLREVTPEMIAQAACFVLGVFVLAFAAKGWVVTWM